MEPLVPRRPAITAACHSARLAPDLESFPDGIHTAIGEGGRTLSGGQRQRVALARALVTDRPILLLDDALSAVDATTEARILAELDAGGRTLVLTTHRLAALRDADAIVELEAGRVTATGAHERLVARGGFYARCVERQRESSALERDVTDG